MEGQPPPGGLGRQAWGRRRGRRRRTPPGRRAHRQPISRSIDATARAPRIQPRSLSRPAARIRLTGTPPRTARCSGDVGGVLGAQGDEGLRPLTIVTRSPTILRSGSGSQIRSTLSSSAIVANRLLAVLAPRTPECSIRVIGPSRGRACPRRGGCVGGRATWRRSEMVRRRLVGSASHSRPDAVHPFSRRRAAGRCRSTPMSSGARRNCTPSPSSIARTVRPTRLPTATWWTGRSPYTAPTCPVMRARSSPRG